MNKNQLAAALGAIISDLDKIWNDEQFDTLLPDVLTRNEIVYAVSRLENIHENILQELAESAANEDGGV